MEGNVGGKMLHYAIAFAERNGEIYTLTAASSPADASLLDKQFIKVLESWQFEKKEAAPSVKTEPSK